MTTSDIHRLDAIPEVSTVLDDRSPEVPEIIRGTGHLPEMRVDPIGLFHRVREECGDVGRFRLADKDVVLVTGARRTRRSSGRPRRCSTRPPRTRS
ncbi:hypothetical protein [Actinomadura sp. CNU-125]|uniref:hypothetical protein n=1 Tax=Actinomadura sp. CNU-125 TaxID=1904961 RepID=UPI002916DBBA|nr:hypothetical protein [Actinomadura sp. CNU-125]